MSNPLSIQNVALDGDDGILVTFSDGTFAAVVIEELLELRPYRELAVEAIVV